VTFRVVVSPPAQHQIREIAHWYATRGVPAVAERFLSEFRRAVDGLKIMAESHAVDERFGRRRAYLKRFPYTVWYEVEGLCVTVLAVTHEAMSNESIRSRIDL
jgi:plasmid stabilization system protein ParE